MVLRKMSELLEMHGPESSAAPALWVNGLSRAERALVVLLSYPTDQYTSGIPYWDEVLPIFSM